MREIIIVLGKTGQGKSTWTRQYLLPFKRIMGYDPQRELSVNYIDDSALVNAFDSGRLKLPNEFRLGTDNESGLDAVGNIAFLTGNCILVIEEASLVFRKGERIEGWPRSIIFLGRHRNVSLIVTAQRAASIPIELRSQATRIVSFAQHESDDLNWLKSFFGKQVYDLPMLPPLTCLDAHDGAIKVYSIK